MCEGIKLFRAACGLVFVRKAYRLVLVRKSYGFVLASLVGHPVVTQAALKGNYKNMLV
jgi:hypothetical protein